MKKTFVSILFVGISLGSFAQQNSNVAKVSSMPEYVNAQCELNQLCLQWQKEIETKYAEIAALSRAYNTDATELNEGEKKQRQSEVAQKEQEVKNLQKQRFGINGDLSKKREALLKPLQDKLSKEAQSAY